VKRRETNRRGGFTQSLCRDDSNACYERICSDVQLPQGLWSIRFLFKPMSERYLLPTVALAMDLRKDSA
jgi:hypothetical protein